MTAGPPTSETAGGFVLTVATAEPSPEAEAHWAQRPEVLANWLISEWQRAHEECKVRRASSSDMAPESE